MSKPTLIYFAGVAWGGIRGTDRQLVEAMARRQPVLWVDPPQSWLARRGREGPREPAVTQVSPGVHRLRVTCPPGITRPVMRTIAWRRVFRRLAQEISSANLHVSGVVVATPDGAFPQALQARRVYFVTDDWVEGADLMGLSRPRIRRLELVNCQLAHVVAAVSPDLAATLSRRSGREVVVLPNGCDPEMGARAEHSAAVDLGLPHPIAGLIGQINERLDLEVLEAVADQGVSIAVVGPRTERDPTVSARLDLLFLRKNVTWFGEQHPTDLPRYLSAIELGMTPYADTAFNRASFPLKTLEYLAAGLPVVSTRLPAVRWIDSPFIAVADGPLAYADQVVEQLAQPSVPAERAARRALARQHSWQSRAEQMWALILN